MVSQRVEVWLSRENVRRVIEAVQMDSGRVLECVIQDMAIPEGATARFFAVKPSGAEIYNKATVKDNVISVELTNQTLAEAGRVPCQIEVLDVSEKRVTSFEMILDVKKTLITDDAVESLDETDVLRDYVNQAKTSQEAAKKSEDAAAKSEAAAKNAQSAAEDAKSKALEAQGAAETAKDKALEAQQAAETAQGVAESARDDAQAAAKEAKASQEAAKKSETNAAASEKSAATSSEVAGQSRAGAEAAQAAAEDARDAALEAQSAAEDSVLASEDWSNKSMSWAIGVGDESRPDQETDNSKYYASQAADSAAQAGTDAGRAETAQAGAQDAWTDADTARTQAQAAQTAAESARDAIENMTVSSETGDPGTEANVEKSEGPDGNVNLHFTIPQGMPGVVTTLDGFIMFTIDENGDLYLLCDEMATPPEFQLDETGDLYVLFEDEEASA